LVLAVKLTISFLGASLKHPFPPVFGAYTQLSFFYGKGRECHSAATTPLSFTTPQFTEDRELAKKLGLSVLMCDLDTFTVVSPFFSKVRDDLG